RFPPIKGASVGGLFLRRPKIEIEQRKLDLAFFEHIGEFLAKLVHAAAQLHDRNNALNLIVNFVTAKFFEPLMMVLQKMWIWILLLQHLPNVTVDRVVDKQHD